MKLKYLLPQVYERLLPAEILNVDLTEKKATCDNCAMAPGRTRTKLTYQPDLKCCTFYPFMPNYLIGATLNEAALAQGKTVIEEIIEQRQFSLPIGLVAPPAYQLKFNQREPFEFGNRRDWLCPYYNLEKDNCNIWKNRGAVCSTFYCKSSYGKSGLRFWVELCDYLTYIEMALLEESLVMLDFSPRQITDLLEFVNVKDRPVGPSNAWSLSEKKARALWNGYYEDQPGFFKKCLEIVTKLDRRAFRETLGELGESRGQKLRTAIEALDGL